MTQLSDLLALDAFRTARCVKKSRSADVVIRSVKRAPSLAVHEWGQPNMAVLLPRPLLQNRTDAQLESFFRDAEQVGISLFLCHPLPLLSKLAKIYNDEHPAKNHSFYVLPDDSSLDIFLLEIQALILEQEKKEFEQYRKIQANFMHFALRSPTYLESLRYFSEMIGFPVSLEDSQKNKWWSTDSNYDQFQVIQSKALDRELNTGYPIMIRIVQYSFLPHAPSSQLHIAMPEINGERHALVIHHFQRTPNELDWMLIEQAVCFFQTEISKKEALKENELQHKNDLLNQLLKGDARSKSDMLEKAARFNLSEEKNYKIIVCEFFSADTQGYQQINSKTNKRTQVSQFLMTAKVEFKNLVYMQLPDRLVLIMEHRPETSLKKKFQRITAISEDRKEFASTAINVSISNPGSILDIPKNYRTATGIQRIMHLLKKKNLVSTYEDIGIYQFFLNSPNLYSFKEAIPVPLMKMYEEDPELVETVRTFLDYNQNYKKTADLLYVHPKTVRYRMEKARDEYGLHLEDPQQTLHIRLSLQLLEFLDKENEE